jgi:hypothetical protein
VRGRWGCEGCLTFCLARIDHIAHILGRLDRSRVFGRLGKPLGKGLALDRALRTAGVAVTAAAAAAALAFAGAGRAFDQILNGSASPA